MNQHLLLKKMKTKVRLSLRLPFSYVEKPSASVAALPSNALFVFQDFCLQLSVGVNIAIPALLIFLLGV